MIEMLAVIAACAVYSLFSKRLARTVLSMPILFACLGLALSVPLKATLPPDAVHEGKIVLAEVTLILVLFADASHVRFRRLRMDWALPARMLVIGMPLTIGFGTALVYGLNPGSDLAMALLTAAVLTPTDAALGQAVVASFQAPNLFQIAGDLRKMQVLANVDEADIGFLRVGASAEFTVDSFRGKRFSAKVSQIRNAAQTGHNVVT